MHPIGRPRGSGLGVCCRIVCNSFPSSLSVSCSGWCGQEGHGIGNGTSGRRESKVDVDGFEVFLDEHGEEEEEETFLASTSDNPEELEFDIIVGLMEECLMDDAFMERQNAFLSDHCDDFDDGDENKLCYSECCMPACLLLEDDCHHVLTTDPIHQWNTSKHILT